jgi:transposase
MKRRDRLWRARGAPKEIRLDVIKEIIERAKASLSESDHATLAAAVDTLAFLTQEIAAQGASIERLRRLIFGNRSTEKTKKILNDGAAAGADPAAGADAAAGADPAAGTGAAAGADAAAGTDPVAGTGAAGADAAPGTDATASDDLAASGTTSSAGASGDGDGRAKAPGHGRNGAAAYRGATTVVVSNPDLRRGDPCTGCDKGKVYSLAKPAVIVRIAGMAPLSATVYACEQLRCNLCGQVFTAPSPPGVGDEKYDETAASMIGLLKYGAGLPFNRIEKLEQSFGIPLPASTQWEVVERAAKLIAPAHESLMDEAAQGDVVHNDDTSMKILELTDEARREILSDVGKEKDADERRGVFTSGIVATRQQHRIALFVTGPKHAGENLGEVLRRRATDLEAPIQMCDALSRNEPGAFRTVLSNCLAHGRRQFVDLVDDFPQECRFLLETLGDVYKHDALARAQGLSPDERLRLHQAQSGPLMAELEAWLREQIDDHKVEPNSGLGKAIGYMRKHWQELTLFLRVAGAPLDNNVCERALKKAILHRKNALFYKTLNGARVGDVFMSLIHTAELNGVDPFAYLVALQRHHEDVAESPADWMPWNYEATLSQLTPAPAPA